LATLKKKKNFCLEFNENTKKMNEKKMNNRNNEEESAIVISTTSTLYTGLEYLEQLPMQTHLHTV